MENKGKIPTSIVEDIRRLLKERNIEGVYDYLKGIRTVIVDETIIKEPTFTEVEEVHALDTEEGDVYFAVRIVEYNYGESKVILAQECYRNVDVKVQYDSVKRNNDSTVISKSELNYLRSIEKHYNHLHDMGVDNWGDYSYPEE